jgi:uncharacterized cysteine cluster protein YcgN (CxxCxxCC family)
MRTNKTAFWETKALHEMTAPEWESLCDGCAKCCLCKLEDADSGTVYYTDVVCRYLNARSCRCRDYANRTVLVPDCVKLTPDNLAAIDWMPSTCAYRLLHEGKPLEEWHPLVSGDPQSVHKAGISVRGRCVSEDNVHPEEVIERVVHWRDV